MKTKPTDRDTRWVFGGWHTNLWTETGKFAGFDRWRYKPHVRGSRVVVQLFYGASVNVRGTILLSSPLSTGYFLVIGTHRDCCCEFQYPWVFDILPTLINCEIREFPQFQYRTRDRKLQTL